MLGFNLRHFQNSYVSDKACIGVRCITFGSEPSSIFSLMLLSVLRRWFCCCLSVVWCASHWLWGFCVCLCFVLHYFVSIILKRKRELVALLLLSYGCLVTLNGLWLFLTVSWGGLRCVIVVIPDHTCLPFYVSENRRLKFAGSFEPSLLAGVIRTKIPYANPYTLHCK